MKAVIRWTLWQRRISTLWWSFGVFAMIFINMIFYPSFKNDAEELQKTFDQLPDAAVQLFGGSTDFFSPVGFLNSQLYFIVLPLLLAILAIGLGNSLLGREEQDGSIESLLSRPISRSKLLAAKAIAGFTILTLVSFVGLVTTLVTARLVDLDVPASNIALASLVCTLFALSLGAIAFLFTASGRARSASLGITAFIGLGGYIISSLAGTVEWLRHPAKLFPFHYYDSESILRGSFDWGGTAFFIILTAACAIVAWIGFRRRDIA